MQDQQIQSGTMTMTRTCFLLFFRLSGGVPMSTTDGPEIVANWAEVDGAGGTPGRTKCPTGCRVVPGSAGVYSAWIRRMWTYINYVSNDVLIVTTPLKYQHRRRLAYVYGLSCALLFNHTNNINYIYIFFFCFFEILFDSPTDLLKRRDSSS